MGVCKFEDTRGLQAIEATACCFDVDMDAFGKCSGAENGFYGLASNGFATCMGVVVHDTATDTGCLAHLGGWGKNNPESFEYALSVIEKMVLSLTNEPRSAEIFLFEGMAAYGDFYQALSNHESLKNARIHNHLNQQGNPANYVYLPKKQIIFAVKETKQWTGNFKLEEYKLETIKTTQKIDFFVKTMQFRTEIIMRKYKN